MRLPYEGITILNGMQNYAQTPPGIAYTDPRITEPGMPATPGGIGGATGLVPPMKRAQLQAELDRATKEMRRLRPMRDKALRDAANQQAIQMPQMNRNWAIGAALLGGLAEAIQPGAGAQGLAGFTQGAQQRMQQEFQNRQLLDESNRRRLATEAQIAGVNLEDAQLDYNLANRDLDQLESAELKADAAKDKALVARYNRAWGTIQSTAAPVGAKEQAARELNALAQEGFGTGFDEAQLIPAKVAEAQKQLNVMAKPLMDQAKLVGSLSPKQAEEMNKRIEEVAKLYGIDPGLVMPQFEGFETLAQRKMADIKAFKNKELGLRERVADQNYEMQRARVSIAREHLTNALTRTDIMRDREARLAAGNEDSSELGKALVKAEQKAAQLRTKIRTGNYPKLAGEGASAKMKNAKAEDEAELKALEADIRAYRLMKKNPNVTYEQAMQEATTYGPPKPVSGQTSSGTKFTVK